MNQTQIVASVELSCKSGASFTCNVSHHRGTTTVTRTAVSFSTFPSPPCEVLVARSACLTSHIVDVDVNVVYMSEAPVVML